MSDLTANARWYDEAKNEVHGRLDTVFKTIRDECRWQLDADVYHAGYYCATDRAGVRGDSRRDYTYGPATLPYNVCRSAVDTLLSKVSQHRPLPEVLTQRGNWKNQKKARKLNQYLEGTFWSQEFFETHWPLFIRDALIFGRGHLQIGTIRDKVTTERVPPWEIYCDPQDARYARPQNLYRIRGVDKIVLIDQFAKTDKGRERAPIVEAIMNAPRAAFSEYDEDHRIATTDRTDMIEAWHLPSGPGAEDGRHVVVIRGITLLDEPWGYDYFPIVSLNYCEPITGKFGTGLVEQLEGFQYEINKAAERSSEQHHYSGVGVINYDGSNIHDSEFMNGVHLFHCRPGAAPQTFDMNLVNEATDQRPRQLTIDALNASGLSQLSVQSQKPAGITAAIALQTLDDIETERFVTFGRAAEFACVKAARMYIDCAKRIAEDYGELEVSVPMKGGLLDLKWSEVVLDGIQLRVFSTSLLPQQLGARLERLKDLWNSQLIDRATFLRHLDAPDMQAELDLETSQQLVVDECLEKMMEAEEQEGEAKSYIPPMAYMDFLWAAKRADQKHCWGLLNGVPEFNLELLRRYMSACQAEIEKMTPPAPANTNGVPGNPQPVKPPPPDLAALGLPKTAA